MVVAFPILLSISVSRVRSLLIVDLRYMNWFTTSSSSMVRIGGTSTSCPWIFIFFRLIVSPIEVKSKTLWREIGAKTSEIPEVVKRIFLERDLIEEAFHTELLKDI